MFRAVAAVVLGVSGAAADWPQFRGPGGQGHADAAKPPTEWAEGQNVVWAADVPGKGWSSPVAAAGTVFVTTAVTKGDSGLSLRAVAVEAATGAAKWDVEVFAVPAGKVGRIHQKNSHASPTPFYLDGRLYLSFGHNGFACLDAATGKKIWANDTLRYQPVHGSGGSVAVAGGKVFACIDGADRQETIALDAGTGKVVWRSPRDKKPRKPFSFCTPLLINMNGREILVSAGSDTLQGLDPATGKELWAYKFDGYSVVPRPVFAHGLLFVSTGYDNAKLLAIKVEPAGDGYKASLAWQSKTGAPNNPSPVVVGDEIYTVSDTGQFACLDAKTGTVHYAERVPGGYSASLLAASGHIYVTNETGVTTVVKAGKTFDVVATNKLPGRTLASLGVDGDALLLRTDAKLYKLGR